MGISDWGVRAKLLLGFGIVLGLFVVTAVITAVKMGHLNDDLNEVTIDRYGKVRHAKMIEMRALDVARLVRTAILADSRDEVEAAIGRIQADRQANVNDLEVLTATVHSDEGKRMLTASKQARERLAAQYETLFPLLRERDHARSVAFLKATFAPANDAFMKTAEDFVAHEEQAMDEARQAAAGELASARTILIATLLLSIAVGLAIAFLISSSIAKRLGAAQRIAERIAAGDLTHSDEGDEQSADEIGRLLQGLRKMRDDLSVTIHAIVGDAEKVNESATHLSGTAQQVATSTENQSQSTSAAAAAVEQLTVSIDHVAANANDASGRAKDAGQLATEGGNEVTAATQRINEVATAVDHTATDIQSLSDQVQRIGSIATVIKEVADQTNLLALNAAIEAARAGEQGRGFAVVADEVRKLAERTTNSVQEITTTISAIQVGADSAVTSMQRSRQMVTSVVESANKAQQSMATICTSTDAVRDSVSEISSAMQEQRAASADLSRSVESIAQMSEENSAAVTSVADTAQGLVDVSASLKANVSRFRF